MAGATWPAALMKALHSSGCGQLYPSLGMYTETSQCQGMPQCYGNQSEYLHGNQSGVSIACFTALATSKGVSVALGEIMLGPPRGTEYPW